MDLIGPIIVIIFILVVARFLGVFRGAPFVPTNKGEVEQMVACAQIKAGDKAADLGSGDGRLLIAAARAGAVARGYEINPFLVWWSRRKIKEAGFEDRVFVRCKDFWNVDFSEFDVVFLFGIGNIMKKLEAKLKRELKPGARVVSYIFRFPAWRGEKIGNVFIYKK